MQGLSELKRTLPGKKIRIPEIVEINGEVLYTKSETALAMNVTVRTLTNWAKEGLEQSKYSTKNIALYNIDYVRDWHKVNKATTKQHQEQAPTSDPESMSEKVKYDDENITMWNAGIAEGIEKARVKRLERIKHEEEGKIRRAEWIPAEIVDKTQRGFITIMLQTLTNKLTSMPPRLAEKKQSEISTVLESEFKDLVIQLKKALKKALVDVKR